MLFKIPVSISKNEESGVEMLAVVVVSVSVVTVVAGELLLIFVGFATSL